ncbi:D-alanyl-D-alanine carboxypeptidase family protein [Geitlerinema sp. PCC 7407]|uniref:M15 family metallopeptidase n=1 Tax=Geitlerinema sp. PCC 7407 TaxID=1173025 RepID=UPI00029F8862|nr:M15 family metallopeptidase [Geitlerinema sp. PCC 7407]AFY65776.1 D-Ala-D-Ala carboxypeptidase [Geitlerinema sp. PCC 7407]
MDKVSGNSNKGLNSPDDIPAAVRDTPIAPHASSSQRLLWIGGGAAAIALLLGIVFSVVLRTRPAPNPVAANPSASPSNSATAPSPGTDTPNPEDGTLLGHFSYEEAPRETLRSITPDGSIQLRQAAADQFSAMVSAAAAEGVSLVPISGFRSLADQEYLFFEVKAERGQVATKRAEVSAPPGYSEHHTGYAVDIGDGNTPATNLSQSFEETRAFQWLQQNAAFYSFELSFPQGNPQGVSYEPWHWRYVGDRASLETFYKARERTAETAPEAAP